MSQMWACTSPWSRPLHYAKASSAGCLVSPLPLYLTTPWPVSPSAPGSSYVLLGYRSVPLQVSSSHTLLLKCSNLYNLWVNLIAFVIFTFQLNHLSGLFSPQCYNRFAYAYIYTYTCALVHVCVCVHALVHVYVPVCVCGISSKGFLYGSDYHFRGIWSLSVLYKWTLSW